MTTEQLIAKHYFDAIKIAASFQTSYLQDVEKEDIAIDGLYWAVDHYNPERAAFTTYLYLHLHSRFKDAIKHAKVVNEKMPVTSMSEYPTEHFSIKEYFFDESEQGVRPSHLSDIAERRQTKRFNYPELLALLRPRLTRKQWLLMNYLFYPEHIQRRYKKYHLSIPPRKVTLSTVAKIFGLSRQRVNIEMQTIRRITEQLLKQIDFGVPTMRGVVSYND